MGLGITPAYAGKRTAKNASRSYTRDHPRLCGEKDVTNGIYFHVSGSPPPMRGKVSSHTPATAARRITPAYAGKRKIHQPR